MCIGPDDGCHDVPDPIAPIAMRFVSLEPTRMPISSPSITKSDPTPTPVSAPCMCPVALGEGLAIGVGVFIICSGEGEASGISIPGLCRCVCVLDGEELGVAAGVGLAVGFVV